MGQHCQPCPVLEWPTLPPPKVSTDCSWSGPHFRPLRWLLTANLIILGQTGSGWVSVLKEGLPKCGLHSVVVGNKSLLAANGEAIILQTGSGWVYVLKEGLPKCGLHCVVVGNG